MRSFLSKFIVFIMPFALAVIFSAIFYTKSGGDLNRIGKIPFPENYRSQFHKDFQQMKNYVDMSEIDLNKPLKFNIFTIGDSFSAQVEYGYQNYLAIDHNLKLLNFNYYDYNYKVYNPLEVLEQIEKEGVIENIKVDFVLLEIVERDIIKYSNMAGSNTKFGLSKLKEISKPNRNFSFHLSEFIDDTKWFCFNNMFYLITDKPYNSDVYKAKMDKALFSTKPNELFFYSRDLTTIKKHNRTNIENLNSRLNSVALKLKNKGVKLIFMPVPDKYDLYSNYIINNPYPKNMFFNILRDLKKDYIFIDSKHLLVQHLENNMKDVYFADDTHWSPKGSRIISNGIQQKLFQ